MHANVTKWRTVAKVIRELILGLLLFVREPTLILFEGGWRELSLSLRVLTLDLLILCKGGLKELALVLTLFKEAIPRSERTDPSSKPLQER